MKSRPMPETRRAFAQQQGYVLVLVLATLALLAYVVSRFAERIDSQRQQTNSIKLHAEAQAKVQSIRAAALYWLGTQRANANGYGDSANLTSNWVADGRWYKLGELGWASLQDQRGLISVNAHQLNSLGRLLEMQGLSSAKVSTMIDVLADYSDTDNLKRLNGAEASNYSAIGLAGPRNDWLLTVRELRQLPVWRDDPELYEKIEPLLSARRSALFNPNTSPMPALRALMPTAASQQLDLFATLRNSAPFVNGAAAMRATGLPLDSDDFMFHSSDEVRLSIWIPGMPKALEYNISLQPGGVQAPWQVTESHSVSRPSVNEASKTPLEFPAAFFRRNDLKN